MKLVQRTLKKRLRALFRQYPVVTVTGPRQSGKTTLCRDAFPKLPYVNLEAPDQREFAVDDPRGFMAHHRDGAVIDEIQRAPDLVSYIQVLVDEERANSRFVLTGSRQFRVVEAVHQSLAGRTALLRLLPFSIKELSTLRSDLAWQGLVHAGFYPRIHDQGLDPVQALGDYFETYVERDVRQISEIRNLSTFRKFVGLCAGRTGQLLNLNGLGSDAGVSHTTAREWISVLEASYIVFRLPPFHANISKRLVKSPKLYFHDVGLAAWLLGIEHPGQLRTHPLRGALFENLVVVEALKHRYNQGLRSNLHFYRENKGPEVDLLLSHGEQIIGVEIKSSETMSSDHFTNLNKLEDRLGDRLAGKMLVYAGSEETTRNQVKVTNPERFTSRLAGMEKSIQ